MKVGQSAAIVSGAVVLAAWLLAGCTPMIEEIQSADHEVRDRAVNALRTKASDTDLDELCRLVLYHPEAPVRADCARALGYMKRAKAVPALIAALEDKHWLVRRSAIDALGRVADPRAATPLVKMLSDKEPEIQRHAATAFQRLKCREAVPVLITKLRFTNRKNPEANDHIDMNREAVKALTHQADRRSLPAVAKMLDTRAGRYAADAVGAMVGQEFKEDVWVADGFKAQMGSPSKAKKWLKEHPEVLAPPRLKEKTR